MGPSGGRWKGGGAGWRCMMLRLTVSHSMVVYHASMEDLCARSVEQWPMQQAESVYRW